MSETRMAKDGGAAFPRARGLPGKSFEGMSLRDWFAGQAVAGLTATNKTAHEVATWAYWVADEMLDVRTNNADAFPRQTGPVSPAKEGSPHI